MHKTDNVIKQYNTITNDLTDLRTILKRVLEDLEIECIIQFDPICTIELCTLVEYIIIY